MSEEHTYPSSYSRGVSKDLDAAWDLLDVLRPGTLSSDIRAFLAGGITGSLMHAREDERRLGAWRDRDREKRANR